MAKIGVEIEIPKNFFNYDVALEELQCGGCKAVEKFAIVNAVATRSKKDASADGAAPARVGSSPKSRFTDFMNHHAQCVIKAQGTQARG
jgi:hypothetical protein